MTTLIANDCIGCSLRFANGLEPICDGTGVISVSDIPASRVLVCPEWPCDEDEPFAWYEAQEGLGYDVPASLQQRIHANVMQAIKTQQQEQPAPISSQAEMRAPKSSQRRVPVIATVAALYGLLGFVIGIGYVAWRWM